MAASLYGRELDSKGKRRKAESSRHPITVDAHITVNDGPIVRFETIRSDGHTYIYAERQAGKPAILLDVTNPGRAKVLSELSWPAGVSGSLLATTGTAALASDRSAAATAAPVTQAISLMDLSDPAKPRVTRQFAGVTAVGKIEGGTILLANADGIWILCRHAATDSKEEKRYADKVVYGESMY